MWNNISISAKLLFTLGFVIVLGFSALVIEQWLTLNTGMLKLANNDRSAMVELLSENVGGGIRWKKPAVIEKAYTGIVGSESSDVSNILTTDMEGETITEFKHDNLLVIDLKALLSKHRSAVSETGSARLSLDNHTVVIKKVVTGKKDLSVGFLAVAFSNEGLDNYILTRSGIAILMSLVAVAVILAALFVILQLLFTRPMKELNGIAHELANGDGDLTRRLNLKSNDELGEFARTINSFIEKLQSVMGNVVTSVDDFRSSISTASDAARQNEHLLNQHTNELNQANAAIQTMSSKLESMSERAQVLASSSTEASGITENANNFADEAVSSVRGLTNRVADIESVIHELDQRSQNIGSVLDVIKGIAEQINLLALNAAIEAARAGEQGRGFAVVADEVRTLASRTQQSTTEIQEIIESLQTGAQTAVDAMEKGKQDVGCSAERINKVKEYLAEITRHMEGISSTNSSVASDVLDQSKVANGIASNIDEINNLSVSILENGKSTASACTELSRQNENLQTHVAFFKV